MTLHLLSQSACSLFLIDLSDSFLAHDHYFFIHKCASQHFRLAYAIENKYLLLLFCKFVDGYMNLQIFLLQPRLVSSQITIPAMQ